MVLALVASLASPAAAEPESAQDRGEEAQKQRAEVIAAEAANPWVPGPDWLENDPDAPSAERLAELGRLSGNDPVDTPTVLPPEAVEAITAGVETAQLLPPQPSNIDRSKFVAPDPQRNPIVIAAAKPPVVATDEIINFAAGSGGVASGDGELVGRGDGAVLDDHVRLETPADLADGVELAVVDTAATERLSSAGLAFELKTATGQAAGSEPWVLKFDLEVFDSAMVDPAGVRFEANFGCTENGVCKESTSLKSVVDETAGTVSVEIPVKALTPQTASQDEQKGIGDPANVVGIPAAALDGLIAEDESQSVIIAAASTSSPAGDFSATRLASMASYEVGLQSGHAELQYAIPLPAGRGHMPDLTLRYSSGNVDAIRAGRNSQASQVGLGWSEPVAAITRATHSCMDNGFEKMCPSQGRHDGFSVNFGGVSSPLIRTSGTSGYDHPDYPTVDGVKAWDYVTKIKNDWRIRRVEQESAAGTVPGQVTGAENNGDAWTTWWEITTGDGTLHVFGRELVFDPSYNNSVAATLWKRGAVHTGPDARLFSLLSVPLFFDGDGNDHCDNDGYCRAGVEWHLDQVVDTTANQAIYFYENEINYFNPAEGTAGSLYDRATNLRAVHWGLRYDQNPPRYDDTTSPFRVYADYAVRDDHPPYACDENGNPIEDSNTVDPEVCTSTPGFYSDLSLAMYTLAVGGVDKHGWEFKRDNANDPKLWLNEIQRVHIDNGTTYDSLPSVDFSKVFKDNRVNPGSSDPVNLPRIQTMTTEAGATISFTYGQTNPAGSSGCSTPTHVVVVRPACDLHQDAQNNWWNKYKVFKVVVDPLEGGSPPMQTSYDYPSAPDWAWQPSGPTEGVWNDYRGHRQIVVTDGTGDKVTHHFFTGMYDDRNAASGTALYGVVQPTGDGVETSDPWGMAFPNRYPMAGFSLGTTHQDNADFIEHEHVMRYQHADAYVQTGAPNGVVADAPYNTSYKITDITDFSQIYDGEQAAPGVNNWVLRTKTETAIDEYGRPQQIVDFGKARADGDNTTEYPADDRTMTTVYVPVPSTTAADKWTIANPVSVIAQQGSPATSLGDYTDATYFSYHSNSGLVKTTGIQRDTAAATLQNREFWYWSDGLLRREASYGGAGSADNQYTNYFYNSTYGWLSIVDGPLSGTVDRWTYVVDPTFGHRTEEKDPNGNSTYMRYDNLGRLEKVWLPDVENGFESFKFSYYISKTGVDVVTSEQLGKTWASPASDNYIKSWEFLDAVGRTIQTQGRHQGDNNQVAVISNDYDNVGRPSRTSRPVFKPGTPGTYITENYSNVAHTLAEYPSDTDSPMRTEGCSSGENVETSRMAAGTSTPWATSLTTTCGLTTRNWNSDNQLTKTTVDARGNTIENTDSAGAANTFTYNVRDQVLTTTDALNNTTTYTYANWNTYGPTQMVDPDRGLSTLTYDGQGRLWKQKDARNVELTYIYDKASRNTLVKQGSGLVSRFYYDQGVNGKGHITRTIDYNRKAVGGGIGTVQNWYTYDSRGRLASVKHRIPQLPGGDKTLSYEYFEDNQPSKVIYPGGVTTEYGYNRLGQPKWMGLKDTSNTANPNTRAVVEYAEFNAAGQIMTLKRGTKNPATNDLTPRQLISYYDYNDRDGRLNWAYTEGYKSPTEWELKQYYNYSYSEAGKVWSVFESSLQGDSKSCFSYDNTNRLTKGWTIGSPYNCSATSATDNTGPEPFQSNYAYDSIGRITSATGHGTAGGAYDYNHSGTGPVHGPASAGSNNYTYDGAGNRVTANISGSNTTHKYDAQNRFQSTTGGTVTSAMLYDTGGERVKRTIGTDKDYYLPSGLEINKTGGQTITLTFAGLNVATYTPNKDIWSQNTDHLGTGTFSASGPTISSRYQRFTPFGEPRTATNPLTGPSDLAFTGQRDDGNLELMYYGARYYDPVLGQFTQADTITADGLNRYAYVRNNPMSYTDPDGRCANALWDFCLDTIGTTGSPTHLGTNRLDAFAPSVDSTQEFQFLLTMAIDSTTPMGDPVVGSLQAGTDVVCNGREACKAANVYLLSTPRPSLSVAKGIADSYCQTRAATCEHEAARSQVISDFGMASMLLAPGLGGMVTPRAVVPRSNTLAIGKLNDLKKLKPGERVLSWPDQGSARLNWRRNEGLLRTEIRRGVPIRDKTVNPVTGALRNNTGFLRAERNVLRNHNWTYNRRTRHWDPPRG